MKKKKKVLKLFNLPVWVCCHLFGENHTQTHGMVVGVIIAYGGVVVAHSGATLFTPVALLVDFTGYTIHAIGLYPVIEHIVELIKNKMDKKDMSVKGDE